MNNSEKPDHLLPKRQYEVAEALKEVLSLTALVQEAIKIVTGTILVLLSVRGLLSFYGAKQGSWLESLINFVTAPVTVPFQSLFADSKAGEVPVFFSMLCVLFLGILLYFAVDLAARYSLRQRILVKKSLLSPAQKAQN